jgi:phenylpropionate dioxygenase-like ring-hydroxylating dioxygenase large terminal subunit
MIPNQWYAVLESREVKQGRPVGVTRMGKKMVFWRDRNGEVQGMSDLCAHRGAALSKGEVKGDTVMCPFHGLRYDATGQCVLIPANGRSVPVPKAFRVKIYPTYETHGFIFIYWGEPEGDIGKPRWFTDLDPYFTYASAADPWNAHYSRVIENQLDVPHVPIVHRNTIGRGSGTVVDGPWIRWLDENRFSVTPQTREDDGTPPIRADEAPSPDKAIHLEFIFPNLWQNYISEKMRVVAAFAPVDDENTVLYLRFYQKFAPAPGVRTVVNKLFMPFNVLVAHQDRRVVTTQRPKASRLKMGETLFPADAPIIAYRRRREELKAAAG